MEIVVHRGKEIVIDGALSKIKLASVIGTNSCHNFGPPSKMS